MNGLDMQPGILRHRTTRFCARYAGARPRRLCDTVLRLALAQSEGGRASPVSGPILAVDYLNTSSTLHAISSSARHAAF